MRHGRAHRISRHADPKAVQPWGSWPVVMAALALGAGLFALSGLSSAPAFADDGGTAPSFTSAAAATAINAVPFSFTVTTSGSPTPALSLSGNLPPTFAFTDNGDGTGTITGNLDDSLGYVVRYNSVTLTATSTSGTATQSFTISVEPPYAAITSTASATAIVGTPFSFTVTTMGTPAPTLTISGPLPPTLSFTDNGDGTATIAGTAGDSDVGQYPVTLSATNDPNPNYPPWVVTQSFMLSVEEPGAPLFTSAAAATAITGQPFSFTVTTTGTPTPALSLSGSLPSAFSFTDNGDGTATIAGDTPEDANVGADNFLTLTATNAQGTATQPFTLTVKPPLTQQLENAPSAYSAADGESFDVQFYAAGFAPDPTFSESGAMPSGVNFVDSEVGFADLQGTTSNEGVYPITVTVHNGLEPDVTLPFTLTVEPGSPVAFTSASSLTVVWGTPFTFTVTTSGVPTVSHIRATFVGSHSRFPPPPFPPGVTFNDNGDGTATISGTLDQQNLRFPYSSPSVQVELTAQDFNGDQATQTFTLTGIDPAPDCVAVDCDSAVNTDPEGSAQANSGGTSGVTATADGVGGLTVGQYTGDPVSTPAVGATGAYFDVAVSPDNAFTSLVIDDCDLIGGNAVQWWNPNQNGGEWESVSNQTFVAGSPNCVAIDIGTASTPSLGDFVGTIFAVIDQVPTPPAFTSAATATATVGQASSFTLTTSGYPAPALTYTGTVPSGMSFVDDGDGTATLSGTPAAGTAKTYILKITAKNSAGSVVQTFSLVVIQTPAVTSATTATFTTAKSGTFKVTTSGTPAPALSHSGTLPSGVNFVDNGNGTATISGTPAAGTGGTYPVTITAMNSAGTVTQNFTLVVNQLPAFNSAATATATVGQASSFTLTTSGYPAPALTYTGTVPSGMSFVDDGDGTATLSGTPAAGTAKTYILKITAKNSAGSVVQTFSLVVIQTPAVTSATTATFTTAKSGTFKVTTSGTPAPALSHSGTLPSGVNFVDNGNGTATISGTPAAGTGGTYPVTITAMNSAGTVTQNFTLVVNQLPAFNSAATATATVGQASSFTLTTSGYPAPALTYTGTVPSGMSFVDDGDGTATLSGTPAAGTAKTYILKITAKNSAGSVVQTFSLVVIQTPAVTSATTATFTTAKSGTFKVTTSGTPAPALSHSGTLPSGVNFVDNGNGTATISGTPAAGTGGTYPVTITAMNSAGTVTQNFTLVVNQLPAFNSAATATATVGQASSFTLTTSGYPAPALTYTGTVPSGMSFVDDGDGTATLSGTPAAGTAKTYILKITAKNSAGSVVQTFSLVVTP